MKQRIKVALMALAMMVPSLAYGDSDIVGMWKSSVDSSVVADGMIVSYSVDDVAQYKKSGVVDELVGVTMTFRVVQEGVLVDIKMLMSYVGQSKWSFDGKVLTETLMSYKCIDKKTDVDCYFAESMQLIPLPESDKKKVLKEMDPVVKELEKELNATLKKELKKPSCKEVLSLTPTAMALRNTSGEICVYMRMQ